MLDKQQTIFLRIEGLAVLLAAVLAYSSQPFSWWWFMLGLLLPDITMLGYALNNKIGAYVYNSGHSLIAPLFLLLIAYFAQVNGLTAAGLIWSAHIGLDRVFGYGLKSTKGFNHTHIGTIGQK